MYIWKLRNNNLIGVPTEDAEETSEYLVMGKDSELIKQTLKDSYGVYGHSIGETSTAHDITAALKKDDYLSFMVLEYPELPPMVALPEGAIS